MRPLWSMSMQVGLTMKASLDLGSSGLISLAQRVMASPSETLKVSMVFSGASWADTWGAQTRDAITRERINSDKHFFMVPRGSAMGEGGNAVQYTKGI